MTRGKHFRGLHAGEVRVARKASVLQGRSEPEKFCFYAGELARLPARKSALKAEAIVCDDQRGPIFYDIIE
jgi:predicted amidohydrolase